MDWGLAWRFKSSPGCWNVQKSLNATTLERPYDLQMQRKNFDKEIET